MDYKDLEFRNVFLVHTRVDTSHSNISYETASCYYQEVTYLPAVVVVVAAVVASVDGSEIKRLRI